jgi:prophage regulatory protein
MENRMSEEPVRVIKIGEVMTLTGLSRSSIYQAIRKGEFPLQLKLSQRSSGWLYSEVVGWLNSRPRGAG